MRIPLSSQAADLILIVSWIKALWAKALLAMVIADISSIAGAKPKPRLTVLAQKSDVSAVIAPNHILDRRRRELRKGFLLLNVEKDNGGW